VGARTLAPPVFNVLIISPYGYGVKHVITIHAVVRLRYIIYLMGEDESIRRLLSEIGRRGGKARAKALTAKQRKESATKASKAAAKARTRRAKQRKAQHD
jgi:hypothetical protein